MADVKSLLKEARKLIDEDKFKEAQECCKDILRKDKQNYLALVLLGKSLQNSEQAALAFQKAIACKRDNPLAWHGLAGYYEKCDDDESKCKLLPVYDDMLKLSLEEGKLLDILNKIGQLGCSLRNTIAIKIIVKYIQDTHEPSLVSVAEKQFINLLKNGVTYEPEDLPSFLNFLNNIYSNNPGDPILELTIVKVITQIYELQTAIEKITDLSFYSTNKIVREWLCQYLFTSFVRLGAFEGFNINNIYETLSKDITEYKYAGLLKSILHYEKEEFLEAYKQCIPLINYNAPDKYEILFIVRCTIKLGNWYVAQKLSTYFLNKVKDENIIAELRKYLFLSLAKQEKWQQALSTIVSDFDVNSFSIDERALLAECYIEAKEPLKGLLETLIDTEYYLPLQALSLIKDNNYEETISLLENETTSTNGLNYYYLGLAYWQLKEYEKCHINFLKSAKLNPNHAYTFLYLGNFYKQCNNDLEKAKKCYEKAYNIKPHGKDIAINLSEVYATLDLSTLHYDLLISLETTEFKDQSWVHFRLGLHLLNEKNWEQAIIKFRNVITHNQNDSIAFECLADAYYGRGSYTSALRAYDKVLTLSPNKSVHALTRIGYIHMLLTDYIKALSTYEEVLKIDNNSLLALKGIADTWMKIAQKKLNFNLYGSARDSIQNALNYIVIALTKENTYTCFHKMLGDSFIFLTKLPTKHSYVYFKNVLLDLQDNKKIEREEIVAYAIACYTHIVKQRKQTSSYDLALAFLMRYGESSKEFNCQVAFNMALSCVKKKPSQWCNWNLLGKLCYHIKKYNLAQHCFIKALLVTPKWSVADIWCNLGTLYLKIKLYKLANYCYWRGQSILPSYSQSWIGQALIAEVLREEEALDLFRHATRLGYHRESALGYADWVCRTLKSAKVDSPNLKYDIHELYAVPYAIDLMHWFCCFESDNACAYTMLGLLQEQYGVFRIARKSYENALLYADETKKNIALMNIGRICLRLEDYDSAILNFKAITEATLDSACSLALAFFKKGLYEDAYSTYDTALHWLSDGHHEKADVLVAMAGILYMFKGPDEAKILLFQSIQLSQGKPTPHSLFAVCGIGILHSDDNLSKLAISELKKFENNASLYIDIGFLKSYFLVCDDKMDDAIKSISDTVYSYPDCAILWFYLAQYCLKASKVHAASVCAQRALSAARYQSNSINRPALMLAIASVAEQERGNGDLGFVLAKKGLHMYPQSSEIWAALIYYLLSSKLYNDKKKWISFATGHMRKHLDMSRNLSRWINLLDKKLER